MLMKVSELSEILNISTMHFYNLCKLYGFEPVSHNPQKYDDSILEKFKGILKVSIEDKRKRSRHKVKNADYIAFKIGDRYRVIKCNKDSPEELGMFFSLHQFEKIQIINLKNK